MTEPERFLTLEQVCEMFNYPQATILAWLERGLPHVVPGGTKRPRHRVIRIRASVLDAWIKGLEVTRTPDPPAAAGPRPGVKPRRLSAWRNPT
jgi:hypothetical protein